MLFLVFISNHFLYLTFSIRSNFLLGLVILSDSGLNSADSKEMDEKGNSIQVVPIPLTSSLYIKLVTFLLAQVALFWKRGLKKQTPLLQEFKDDSAIPSPVLKGESVISFFGPDLTSALQVLGIYVLLLCFLSIFFFFNSWFMYHTFSFCFLRNKVQHFVEEMWRTDRRIWEVAS